MLKEISFPTTHKREHMHKCKKKNYTKTFSQIGGLHLKQDNNNKTYELTNFGLSIPDITPEIWTKNSLKLCDFYLHFEDLIVEFMSLAGVNVEQTWVSTQRTSQAT